MASGLSPTDYHLSLKAVPTGCGSLAPYAKQKDYSVFLADSVWIYTSQERGESQSLPSSSTNHPFMILPHKLGSPYPRKSIFFLILVPQDLLG